MVWGRDNSKGGDREKMRKVYITGGDNCYCCECGGVCDRLAILVDTEKKTLEYLPCPEMCRGKWCWFRQGYRHYMRGNRWAGWYIERRGSDRHPLYIFTDGATELPVVVKKNKWGKDGEYGNWGIARRIGEEWVLVSYETYSSDNPERTGWKFIEGEKE